jgi:hypothetical protein
MRPRQWGSMKRSLELFKLCLDVVQAVGTIVALGAGLWWFLAQRSTHPNLKLEQTVTQRHLANDDNRIQVFVDVRVTNIGKVKIDLSPGTLSIYQVYPSLADKKALKDYALDNVVLEPGESDQPKVWSFFVYDNVKTIDISSSYPVPGTDKYWKLESVVNLGSETLPGPVKSSTGEVKTSEAVELH